MTEAKRRSLPPAFMERGTDLANDMTIFGVPLTALTREELLAVAALGWDGERKVREQSMAAMANLRSLRGRSG